MATDRLAEAPALRLRGICKRFGELIANDDISLELRPGEVLAVLGENGAGKSTLVSILFGHYRADSGRIEVFGQPLPPGNSRAALDAGIGMVHQHFTLADNLSVLDNVMLGSEALWLPFSRRAAARLRLLDTARRFGLEVEPDALVGSLSVGERQRVEILKALMTGPAPNVDAASDRPGSRILILDEPTAVLTPSEVESLFVTLQRLVAQGLSLIFISHKLDEVLRVCDRIAVLRSGRLVACLQKGQADKARLAELMVGHQVAGAQRRPANPGRLVCEMRGARVRGGDGRLLLDDIDLQLFAGEVLAIAGVSGNGQQALAETLFGLRRLDAGQILLEGRDMPDRPVDWVAAGVARIPEDRHSTGVVGDLPLWENTILERCRSRAFSRAGWIRRGAARVHAAKLVEAFDVRGTEGQGVATPTRGLSGGNMQKLILARVLMPEPGQAAQAAPKLIVADQPTWGLDIGAVAYVHQRLLDASAQGSAVLLICEDLDEIFAIADRIAVIHKGRLSAAWPRSGWTRAEIGLAMAGGQLEMPHERAGSEGSGGVVDAP